MSDFRAIADRVEIEALRGEFTDAVMMRDYDRGASLFTPDGAVRMPHIPVELEGREQIRAWGERVPGLVDYFVQTTHPGTIQLDGDTASGRAYLQELVRFRDGRSHLNYAIYHDRYQRTGDGWKFTERVYEIRYLDTQSAGGRAASGGSGARRAELEEELHELRYTCRDAWWLPAPRRAAGAAGQQERRQPVPPFAEDVGAQRPDPDDRRRQERSRAHHPGRLVARPGRQLADRGGGERGGAEPGLVSQHRRSPRQGADRGGRPQDRRDGRAATRGGACTGMAADRRRRAPLRAIPGQDRPRTAGHPPGAPTWLSHRRSRPEHRRPATWIAPVCQPSTGRAAAAGTDGRYDCLVPQRE